MSIVPLSDRPDILRIIGNDTQLHRVTSKELAGACPKCGGVDRFRVSLERNLCVCSHCHDRNDHWLTPVDYVAWRDGTSWQEAKAKIEGRPLGPIPAIKPSSNGHKAHDQEPWGPVVARYDYRDASGTLLYQVQRHEPGRAGKPKDFSQRRPDGKGGWITSLGETPRVLYRLPELLASIGIVWLCEGEKDTDALAALGLAATTKPGGAEARWRPAYTDALRGREVVILPDKDEPGRKSAQAALDALKPACPAVLVLELPGDGKDVSDWIAAGGTRKQLEDMVADATKPQPARLAAKTLKELLAMRFPAPVWAVPDLLPHGLTIFAGKPKLGKSYLMLQIGMGIAWGGYVLGKIRVDRGTVLYLDMENGEELLQERVQAALYGQPCPDDFHYATVAPALDQGLMDLLTQWMADHPQTRLIVIDTFEAVRPAGKPGKNAYREDYADLRPLADLAKQLRVPIVVVHHISKKDADDVFSTFSGSYGLTGSVDSLMALTGTPADSRLSAKGRRVKPLEWGIKWDETVSQWSYTGEAADVRRTKLQDELVDVLKDAEGPLSPRDVADRCSQKYDDVRQRLYQLSRLDGSGVSKDTWGKYSYRPPARTVTDIPNNPNNQERDAFGDILTMPEIPNNAAGGPNNDQDRGDDPPIVRTSPIVRTPDTPIPNNPIGYISPETHTLVRTVRTGSELEGGRPSTKCPGCGKWMWTQAGRTEPGWHCSNCGCEYASQPE